VFITPLRCVETQSKETSEAFAKALLMEPHTTPHYELKEFTAISLKTT
jgi:hypothetical protein